jgi:hypothetical protein
MDVPVQRPSLSQLSPRASESQAQKMAANYWRVKLLNNKRAGRGERERESGARGEKMVTN